MTASSSACTPLFLNEAPHSTGTMKLPTVAVRIACRISAIVSSSPPRYFSITRLVVRDGGVDDVVTRLLDRLVELGRHFTDGERLAERLVVEDVLLALDDVDVAGEHVAGADGELDRERVPREAAADHLEAAIEVRADAIHLVREDQARHAVAIRLAPHRLRLRLDAGDGVEQRHGAVEHAKRPLHFDGEVDVSRRVDDVDPVLDTVTGPEARGRGGRDRDAALLLLLHPVHGGSAIVDFTDFVALPRVIEDALGGGRLPGIDVGHDADVPVVIDRGCACHISQLSRLLA